MRLSEVTLAQLPATVRRPGYDRSATTPGIVHLGVGAFHRAHQAAYMEECLAAGERGWAILGASLRRGDTRDALEPQDGLYTLAIRSGETERLDVIGSITRLVVAPEDPEALVTAMADPAVRIVTLTVTEKAYLRNAEGGLDAAHPEIAADLADSARPRTLHGFIVEALARRRAAGVAPFTVLSCDNLPNNGRTTRRVIAAFARLRDADLGRFVEEEVAFPSSMVDRIVPATTDADRSRVAATLGMDDAWPVMTEPFMQWVVEDHFPAGRPDWERFGVTMVADVTPYEEMKLRLLNGTHSSIAYLGQLLGRETVAEAFADPAIRRFVEVLWEDFIVTLPADAGLDTSDYTARLAERYANTALRHRTAQIANDGSQKLPQRIVAATLERMERGLPVDRSAFVLAAWITALQARGTPPAFTDPLDSALTPILSAGGPEEATVAAVFKAAGLAAGSSHREELIEATARALAAIRRDGVAAALAGL
ncbi:mannitol dehydrogenase family protein [Kaistia geumhonensis]|uniref:Fructuronate reductase n=1 Tax=Kaistia geumhonensis TaxID=410839 RepID=A0ABU0M2G7_9HYPH|nr:mannitol dehydrogenase family protein [Kaistia geumhonensis]MCX5479628.1 mannitol dehydrogenase family protein [Kaistia geumhonensis]MDQ0515149.1 fructuronate reductase [Kaistia geumhonensis]